MKRHTRIYLDFVGMQSVDTTADIPYLPCEIPSCGGKVVDVHHIIPRCMGGSKSKDHIENIMGLCRNHHDMAESKKLSRDYLTDVHLKWMKFITSLQKIGARP